MSPELNYLVLTAVATSLMWAPYIVNAMLVRGVFATLGYPGQDAPPLSPWAERAKRAHYNAIENLVVFASLILTAHLANVHSELISSASAVYFWARVGHFVVYTARIPVARTLAFLVGFGCQVAIALALLSG